VKSVKSSALAEASGGRTAIIDTHPSAADSPRRQRSRESGSLCGADT
jgi:hypothetical protein